MTLLLTGTLVLIALSAVACIAGQPIDMELVEREIEDERASHSGARNNTERT